MKLNALTFLLLALASLCSLQAAPRVICFGDSITKRGYPAEMAKILDVEVIAAGIAGNSSGQGLKRIQTDVLDKSPTHVVVFFGTNDLRIDAPHVYATPETYANNLREIIKQCHSIGAQTVICTPPPINRDSFFTRHETEPFEAAGGLEAMLEANRQAVFKVANEFQIPVVDLNQLLLDQPTWMHKDGVHPTTPAGNQFIAQHIAKALKPLLN